MERQEAHVREFSGGSDGPGDRVRNVVEFQVEENLGAGGCELMNCAGAFGSEEFASNFQKVGDSLKPPGQPQGWPQAVSIQRDD